MHNRDVETAPRRLLTGVPRPHL